MFEVLFWSIGSPIAYLTMAGFVHKKVHTHLRANSKLSKDGDDTAAFFAAAFWPATGPLALGRWLANWNFTGPNLAKRKQTKALAKADFMIEIAKRAEIEAKHLAAAEAANPLSISGGTRSWDEANAALAGR